MQLIKLEQFLANKKLTQNKVFRKSFARLKAFAYDIEETWSHDLAHVDNFSKNWHVLRTYWLLLTVFHDI